MRNAMISICIKSVLHTITQQLYRVWQGDNNNLRKNRVSITIHGQRAPPGKKDQTSKGRSFRLHRVDPRFPPSAPQGRPHSTNAFWVQHGMEGEYRRSALGECLLDA
ncbi:hypothetical protein R3P38DRAFT_1082972 [Favolaschia claudopus]|uniref:Uncharacterized protein n=1 Tax=Favolaschia claudopus TaxID=2862362 RepID=A0AAW0BBZ7_9AGAR